MDWLMSNHSYKIKKRVQIENNIVVLTTDTIILLTTSKEKKSVIIKKLNCKTSTYTKHCKRRKSIILKGI